jgi:hypothetical protein
LIALLRRLRARLLAARAPRPRFADVLDRTLRDGDAFVFRLSTVERSVGLASTGPQERARRED